jgi:hypothetical protein
MKKILFLFLACIFVSSFVFSQTREYEDWYLLPDPFWCEGCSYYTEESSPLDLDINSEDNSRCSTRFITHSSSHDKTIRYIITDWGQRFETDETIKIAGISALFKFIDYGQMYGYLCIADSSFNILQKVKLESYYDTIDGNAIVKNVSDHYIELFFDTVISVNGIFYAMIDNPKPYPIFPDEYNWGEGIDPNNPTAYSTFIYRAMCWKTTNVTFARYISFDKDVDNDYLLDSLNSSEDWEQRYNEVLYLFPILADTTIVDTTDSSSLVNIVDNYTFIFPNPANKEVNIQCSFRMQTLELFNEQGQEVNEWKVDSYHYLLNVEDYPKGNYVMKIKTKSGTATKKVIVQ